MKKKSDWRTRFIRLCAVVLPLIVLCFTACKDEDKEENLPFDPTKPVVITDFSPKSGGIGNNIILYGENFGNDPKKLKVIVGGKEANIISVKNNILYCVVPRWLLKVMWKLVCMMTMAKKWLLLKQKRSLLM